MYRDEQEALRARIHSLETQLNAEARKREAAEAETEAARALVYEQKLLAENRHVEAKPLQPMALAALFWPLALLLSVSTITSLYLGAWHARVRAMRTHPAAVTMRAAAMKRCPHFRVVQREATVSRHPLLEKVEPEKRYAVIREKRSEKAERGTESDTPSKP